MAEFLQRRRLPDDVLEYLLIPNLSDGLDERSLVSWLEKACDTYLGHIGPLVIDYIWQNDGFTLRPVTDQGSIPPHLSGKTNFGDNIEDEWFIVYLLYELSRHFPDLVIRVSDNDEEFMLIEAADHLPAWLNPETAEKRVYIHGGNLHVVPIPQSPSEVSTYPLFTPTIQEAVALVRDPNINTRAAQPIQDALFRRLNSCRSKMQENTHFANLYVPVTAATVLKEKPASVSAAVQAFYYRDPVDLKVCRTMAHFKPENMVVTRVRFTRCLYAQLLQQKFKPDKRSGWVLSSTSNPKFKEQDLGMKLSHGFEILCAKRGNNTTGSNGDRSTIFSNSVPDVRWSRFLKSLQEKGYFQGELEGSQMYNKLLEDAKGFFQSQLTDSEHNNSDVVKDVLQILSTMNHDVGPWKQLEKALPPSDDDSWLDLSPDSLDEMMRSAAGLTSNAAPDQLDLQKVADSMTTFVDKVSGLDGVEFPSQPRGREDGEGDMELDGTSFIHAMQKMFEFKDDEDDSSSDMSEYDWEENSDDDLGSPTKMAGTRPAVPAPRQMAPKPPPRPKAKPPARPAKPPAVPPKPPSRPSRPSARRKDPEIEAIMEAMDRELAKTEVGKSFEREPPRPKPLRFQPKPREQNGGAPSKPSNASSKLVSRPAKPTAARPSRPPPPVPPKPSSSADHRDIDDEDDDFRPVNIDVNVVKNTLESFRAQQGLPGPASNILQNMGIVLPPDEDKPSQ